MSTELCVGGKIYYGCQALLGSLPSDPPLSSTFLQLFTSSCSLLYLQLFTSISSAIHFHIFSCSLSYLMLITSISSAAHFHLFCSTFISSAVHFHLFSCSLSYLQMFTFTSISSDAHLSISSCSFLSLLILYSLPCLQLFASISSDLIFTSIPFRNFIVVSIFLFGVDLLPFKIHCVGECRDFEPRTTALFALTVRASYHLRVMKKLTRGPSELVQNFRL